jgi:hypothetical protein
MRSLLRAVLGTSFLATTLVPALLAAQGALDSEKLKSIAFRSIGPGLVTGRIADVEFDPKDPNIWYVATAFGGLWKTVNRGVTFEPIFDQGPSFNLCCVVVDPRNPDIVWLGTGENHSQRSAHFGDGVYKSSDAGKTWKRVGLETSEHIGRIVIDPRNSNVVFVAAQGPLFSSGGGAGVIQDQRWWKHLVRGADDQRKHRHHGHRARPEERGCDVRVFVPAPPPRRDRRLVADEKPASTSRPTVVGRGRKSRMDCRKCDIGRIALAADGRRNPTEIYALVEAQGGQGFYKSSNGGTSWTRYGKTVNQAARGGGAGGGAPQGGRGGGRGNATADSLNSNCAGTSATLAENESWFSNGTGTVLLRDLR